jgi:hypothetical protein
MIQMNFVQGNILKQELMEREFKNEKTILTIIKDVTKEVVVNSFTGSQTVIEMFPNNGDEESTTGTSNLFTNITDAVANSIFNKKK